MSFSINDSAFTTPVEVVIEHTHGWFEGTHAMSFVKTKGGEWVYISTLCDETRNSAPWETFVMPAYLAPDGKPRMWSNREFYWVYSENEPEALGNHLLTVNMFESFETSLSDAFGYAFEDAIR